MPYISRFGPLCTRCIWLIPRFTEIKLLSMSRVRYEATDAANDNVDDRDEIM